MKEFNLKNLTKALYSGLSPTMCARGFNKHKQEISRFMLKNRLNIKEIRQKIYEKTFGSTKDVDTNSGL